MTDPTCADILLADINAVDTDPESVGAYLHAAMNRAHHLGVCQACAASELIKVGLTGCVDAGVEPTRLVTMVMQMIRETYAEAGEDAAIEVTTFSIPSSAVH